MTNNEDSMTNAVDPLILEIYLYKNNYKDRVLISELKKRAQVVKIPGQEGNSFFVGVEDMQEILYTRFVKDLNDFDSTPTDSLNLSVTSIFFIDSMMKGFSSLKYFKINVSDSSVYTRKSKDRIIFDYRIIHSKINLPRICTPEFLEECKRILIFIGAYKPSIFDKKPYLEISAKDLMYRIRNYEMEINPEEDPEEMTKVINFKSIFGTKLENDDSLILLVIEK